MDKQLPDGCVEIRSCGGQFIPKESIIKIAKERNAMKRELGLLGDALGLSGNTKLSDYLTKIKELQDEIGKLWKKSFDDLIEEFDELNYKEDLVLMEDQNCEEGRDGLEYNLNEIELGVMGLDNLPPPDAQNLVNKLAKWFDDIPVEIAIQHQNDWIEEAGVGLMDDY